MRKTWRAFVNMFVVTIVTAMLAAGAAGATARLGCETASDADHAHMSHMAEGLQTKSDVSAPEDCAGHKAKHCVGAACAADLCTLMRVDLASRLPRSLDLHAEGASLRVLPAPEGLQRPPQV